MSDPIVALIYDFDKTLCTKDMQEYGFIPALGMSAEDFWKEAADLTNREEMDNILAYMLLMVDKSREKQLPIQLDTFKQMGKGVEFFPGVLDWFGEINAYAKGLNIRLEHYIVSSGIKEIIQGTPIARKFKKIYACEFLYDYNGIIKWPKVAVNYTAKTQFLFRINKGVLDLNNESSHALNQFTPEHERRVPFQRMIYIGDGLTDVPCMKLVKTNGGHAIAVHDPTKSDDTARKLLEENRVNHIAPADYTAGSTLDTLVKMILTKLKAVHELSVFDEAQPKAWAKHMAKKRMAVLRKSPKQRK